GVAPLPAPPSALYQAAERPICFVAASAAPSTYREYASRAALGRRLASGPLGAACTFFSTLLSRSRALLAQTKKHHSDAGPVMLATSLTGSRATRWRWAPPGCLRMVGSGGFEPPTSTVSR